MAIAPETGVEIGGFFVQHGAMGEMAGVPTARSTRQSIMAFLDGEQTLDWVLSVIGSGADLDSLHQFVRDLKGYGDPERRDQLLRRLEAA